MLYLWLIGLGALLSIVWYSFRYGISPTPTSPKVKKELFALLPNISEGKIYELGAGFGTLAFPLADRYPRNQIIAIEISPLPYLWMTLRQVWHPRSNLTLLRADFFDLNLPDATLIVCYLYPVAMERLEKKLLAECHSTLVLSHTFAFPHLKPIKQKQAQDMYKSMIFLYQIGKGSRT